MLDDVPQRDHVDRGSGESRGGILGRAHLDVETVRRSRVLDLMLAKLEAANPPATLLHVMQKRAGAAADIEQDPAAYVFAIHNIRQIPGATLLEAGVAIP